MTKNGRTFRGRESPFTAEQRQHIRCYYSEWEELLKQHDSDFTNVNAGPLKRWRKERSHEILHSEAFFNKLDYTQCNKSAWEKVWISLVYLLCLKIA